MNYLMPKNIESINDAEYYLSFIWDLPLQVKQDIRLISVLYSLHYIYKDTYTTDQ